jgi:type IX secretion system PorP/SprF family membrane protein
MKIRLLFIVYCLLPTVYCISQDIHFAQLSETPLLVNPALTGVYDGYYRGILNFRNQWPAMGKPYNTLMGSYDMPLEMKKRKASKIGVGAFLFSDKAGDSHFGTTQGSISVSAILPAGAFSRMSAGMQFGLVQHSMAISDIQWPNQYNGQNYDPGLAPNEQINKNSFSFFDMGIGADYEINKSTGTLNGKDVFKFSAGAAFYHATMPLQKFYSGSDENQYPRIVAHASMRQDFAGTVMGIVPSCIFMMQGPAKELNIGALLRYKVSQGTKVTGFYTETAVSGGLYYRFKDAISPQVYLEFSDYAVGLSYDFNVSSYGQVKKSAGGFEISIRYSSMKGAVRKEKR